MSQRIRGVLAPVVTPFKDDLSPDSKRFIAHCKWLLSQNCGLAIFGTNSEANSLSMEERALLLDELVAAGVDPAIGDRSLFGDRVRFVVPADSLQLRDNKFPARICFGRHERNQRFYPLNCGKGREFRASSCYPTGEKRCFGGEPLFISSITRRHNITAILALLIFLQGCVSTLPRFQNAESGAPSSVQDRGSYKLAFIEFGEQGSYLDTSQLEAAVNLVRYAQKPLVITYVHGWHNDSGSDDVGRFAQFLSEIAATPLITSQGIRVIGVYLGWRGELTKVPIVNELTFYSRKTAAERLASNFDCFDAISSVAEAARGHHGRANRYTVLIGHSFGGLVVERAVAHAIDAKMHGRGAKGSELPADLTLVLNPASDSILSRQIISALYQKKTENARPLFVSITSKADDATGKIFPLATSLSSVSKGFPQVSDPGSNKMESERKFYTSTPGHNEALINHEAQIVNRPFNPRPGLSALEMNLSKNLVGDTVVLPGKDGRFELWELRRTSTVDVPYWNVKVDDRIIASHGDIWNTRVEALMAGIFRIANPLRPAKDRVEANLEKSRDFRRGRYKQPELVYPKP